MRSTLQVEGDMHVKLYLSAGTTLICGGICVPYGSTLTIEGEGTLISDATGAVFGDAPLTATEQELTEYVECQHEQTGQNRTEILVSTHRPFNFHGIKDFDISNEVHSVNT